MSTRVNRSQPHDGWQESEDYHVLGPRKLCPSAVWIALDLGLMSKQAPATCAVGCATGQRAARCSRFLSQRAYEGAASLPCASAGSAGVFGDRRGGDALRRRSPKAARALQNDGIVTHFSRGDLVGSPKPAHSPWGDAPRSSPDFRVPQNPGSRSSDTSQNQAPAEAERSPESARAQ